jgi:hypothetical protein
LIGSFFWGFLIVTAKKGIAIEISYSLVTFFQGFHAVTTGKVFLNFVYVTKEKEHQNTW